MLQPTRELAAQCHSMLQALSRYISGFTSVPVFGGSSIRQQRRDLEATPDFVVATTGRLLDHVHNTKGFSLEDSFVFCYQGHVLTGITCPRENYQA